MSESWAFRQWARFHPLAKVIAAIAGLAVLLAASFALRAAIHNRLSPRSAADLAHLSVLVLPFVNDSGDPAQDPIAVAITDRITLDLSRRKDSFVIGRGTAYSFQGKSIDIRKVAGELGVHSVLRGTVARDGEKLHIATQWVDGATAAPLSAEIFDGDLADIEDLRQEIASRIAVDVNSQRAGDRAKKSGGKRDPDAVDLAMSGLARFNQGIDKDTLLAAQRDFTKALALAPDEEEALTGRGRVMAALADRYPDADSAQRLLDAEQDLARALAIDPQDPIALHALSGIEAFQGSVQKALSDNQQAIDQDPSFPEALELQARLLVLSGKSAPALKMINRALELSPFDPHLAEFFAVKCTGLIQFHEYAQAVTFCAKSVALRPDWRNVSSLVVSYMIIGDLDHVKQTKDLLLRIKPDFTIHATLQMLDAASENPEYRSFTERLAFYLKQAGLPE